MVARQIDGRLPQPPPPINAPLAFLVVITLIFFQDLGFKLIFTGAALWFLGYWLIPELMDRPRELVFITPGETDVTLRGAFAILEGILASVFFLVGKFRNWVP